MNASKSLLRPACFVSRRLATASSREKAHGRNLFALRRSGSTAFEIRCFSAQHEKVICYEDLVKETLKKMIAERDVDQLLAKPIADEDLRRRFQRFEVRGRKNQPVHFSTWFRVDTRHQIFESLAPTFVPLQAAPNPLSLYCFRVFSRKPSFVSLI